MAFERPCSPGHCLLMLNETMQTGMLRLVHETIYDLKDKAERSPILYMIDALEVTLDFFKDPSTGFMIGINPFNADPGLPYKFDLDEAYLHDLDLMMFQLEALREIAQELTASGYFERRVGRV